MSGAAVVVSGVAGLIVGVVMTSPVNSYLATLRTEGIAARPAVPWAVAIATGLTFVAGAAAADDGWHAVPLLVAATGLAAVSATDVRSYRIADRILFPSITATLLAMIVVAVGPGQFGDLWRALVAGAVFSGLLLLVALIAAAGGLGLGDVKLAILLGMVVGWSAGSNDDVALAADVRHVVVEPARGVQRPVPRHGPTAHRQTPASRSRRRPRRTTAPAAQDGVSVRARTRGRNPDRDRLSRRARVIESILRQRSCSVWVDSSP